MSGISDTRSLTSIAPRPIIAGTKPNGTIAPSNPQTADKVEIRSKSGAGKVSVPAQKPKDSVDLALGLMVELFGVGMHDQNGVGGNLRKQIAASPDGINFYDIGFRRALAKDLHGAEADSWSDGKIRDKITDEALDYFFGNQDGKTDKKDKLTLAQLIKRLEFLVPRFKAQVNAGGESAYMYLSSHKILIVKYDPKYFNGINFTALARSKDWLFNKCLEAVGETYRDAYLKGNISRGEFDKAKEAYEKAKSGNWDPEMPAVFKELLFSAYWGRFRAEIGARKLDLPEKELKKDPKLLSDLMTGAFQNFIEGHSDKNNPAAITHDLPDKLDEKGIRAAKVTRDTQIKSAQYAAKKPGQVSAPQIDTTL